MSRYTAPRTRRMLGVLTAGAALAAMLTTGAASAQNDEQPPLSCSEALQKLTAAQEAAGVTEADGSDTQENDGTDAPEADGSDELDGADDVPEGDGSDKLDGADDELDGVEDAPEEGEAEPFDASDEPEVDGSDEPEADGSDELDGAADQPEDDGSDAPEDDGSDVPETDGSDAAEADESSDATAAQKEAVETAKTAADTACKGAQGDPGKDGVVTAPVSTVWCVLKPGVCAEVRLDAQGRLVAVIRQVNCPTDNLPAPTGSRRGERVTVVSAPAPGSVTILPGTGGVPQAPAPTIVESDLPVTH